MDELTRDCGTSDLRNGRAREQLRVRRDDSLRGHERGHDRDVGNVEEDGQRAGHERHPIEQLDPQRSLDRSEGNGRECRGSEIGGDQEWPPSNAVGHDSER